MRHARSFTSDLLLVLLPSAALLSGCPVSDGGHPPRIGTITQREQLLSELVDKTARREAFSPVKNERLGLDVIAKMESLAPDFAAARTEVDLFYALVKLSSTRRDRHLSVSPVKGGLAVPGYEDELEAPVRFATDYGTPGAYELFVTDLDPTFFGEAERAPAPGDRVVAIDGRPVADHVAEVATWYRWSTVENLWWHVAAELNVRSSLLPPDSYSDRATYELRGADGATFEVSAPYLPPDSIAWVGPPETVYPELELAFTTETYALYRHTAGRDVVLLRWFGFHDTLVEDVDRLTTYAEQEGLLDHAVIVDATASRGGSRGTYALARLTGRPFRCTFGNLRLSDVVPAFVAKMREELASGELDELDVGDEGAPARLLAWLEGPVTNAFRAGEAYSGDVPFKLAYLPADSDGWIEPAAVHFRGPLVAFFGPGGGSHLDQFAAMIVDNDLGHTIGLPTGGFSNTWEWSEVVTLPGTDRPLAEFMWSIGQTIRPNGEVLEGNPAQVHERVPPTAENGPRYHALLLEHAYAYLDALGRS